jgi:hypothetical protein
MLLAAFASVSIVKADGCLDDCFWYGNPDPYGYEWIISVCIDGVTDRVGYFEPPSWSTDEDKVNDAQFYTGTELTIGACKHAYTGRWVHTYVGKTWSCNLVSKVGEDINAPRFSNLNYLKGAYGEHHLYGPFLGTADY